MMSRLSEFITEFIGKALKNFLDAVSTKGYLLGKPFLYVYREEIPEDLDELLSLLAHSKTKSIKILVRGQEFKGTMSIFKSKNIPNLVVHLYTTFIGKYMVTWKTLSAGLDKVNIDLREILALTLVIYLSARTAIFSIGVHSSLGESVFPKYSPPSEFNLKKILGYINVIEDKLAYKRFLIENLDAILDAFKEAIKSIG